MAVATIANGKMAGKLHSTSAVIFFVLWAINMLLINSAFYSLKKRIPNIISNYSMCYKFIMAGLMWAIIVVELL